VPLHDTATTTAPTAATTAIRLASLFVIATATRPPIPQAYVSYDDTATTPVGRRSRRGLTKCCCRTRANTIAELEIDAMLDALLGTDNGAADGSARHNVRMGIRDARRANHPRWRRQRQRGLHAKPLARDQVTRSGPR
jgi:hypothetical protein